MIVLWNIIISIILQLLYPDLKEAIDELYQLFPYEDWKNPDTDKNNLK